MGTPRLPRPVMPNPALQRAVEDDLRPDAETLRNALLDAGLDPDTIPAAAARTQQNQRSIADILEDEIIAEVLADDLSNKEASLVAGAMWTGVHHKNVERARSVWRVVTFLLKFPAAAADDIPPRLLTDTFFASYRKPRATMSSLIHHWSKTNLFSMARDRLNSFPLTRWSQHRRNQMDVICQWESEICERAETRRKDRLVKKLKPKGLKS